MATQENPNVTDAVLAGSGTNPPLVEVASQLLPDAAYVASPETAVSFPPPEKPQVVFVEQQRQTKIIEIHVDANSSGTTEADVDEYVAPAIAPPMPLPPTFGESQAEDAGRFAVDPFVYEIDGPIPVMPTLPIAEPSISTDQVVAREQSGEHFAWRLMPSPYPVEGNVSQVPFSETSKPADSYSAQSQPDDWTETEVVAENENRDHGDCFFAQAGDVISIDGNQGFDHIDLRSYSIDDATFQQGAILLHANLGAAEAGESEQLPKPITIRHRGIEFAVFKGEVRVQL